MSRVHLLGFMALALPAGASAVEPLPPVAAPVPPTIMMVSATNAPDGTVVLHVRRTEFVPVTHEVTIETPIIVADTVNGRPVEIKRVVAQKRLVTEFRAQPGAVFDVPLNCTDVMVTDLKGKPVDVKRLPQWWKKEQAVLVSFSGLPDPFFLQTTKPGTPVLLLPPQHLSTPLDGPLLAPPAGEPLPAPMPGLGEPPLAPARPR